MERLRGKVDKGWGYEVIWATNDKYCGKILFFEINEKICLKCNSSSH